MWFMNFIKNLLEGRGFYPSLIVILSWTYAIIIFGVLIYEFLLYIFRVKYHNAEFNYYVNKNLSTKRQKDE